MRRLRLLRILLPALVLVPFLIILFIELQPAPTPIGDRDGAADRRARAEDVTRVDYVGDQAIMHWWVDAITQSSDLEFEVEGVDRLQYDRKGQPPLIVSAATAGVSGAEGRRVIHLADRVQIEEPGRGLIVRLDRLEIHEADAEARSVGTVGFETPDATGEAEIVIYGLEDQPTVIRGLTAVTGSGVRLEAPRAVLLDGIDDIQFEEEVRWNRGDEEYLYASTLRAQRGEDGRLERVRANGKVRGAARRDAADGTPRLLRFAGERLDALWGDDGEPQRLDIRERARVAHGPNSIAGERILAERDAIDDGWTLRVRGSVELRGRQPGSGELELDAAELEAHTDSSGGLLAARAAGQVSFRGNDMLGEADEVEFRPGAGEASIVFYQKSRRRARLGRANSRIAAERIVTNRTGTRLDAYGQVESTLLPAPESADATAGLFRTDEAIHFVSGELHTTEQGRQMEFEGSVRSWQGDRTLSADLVTVDQQERRLVARGRVSTRIPRDAEGAAVSEADFIQVSAERLDYAEAESLAVYQGDVRIRQTEGWLQANRVEIDVDPDDGAVRELRASGSVGFEFRAPPEEPGEAPVPVSGRGDRLIYTTRDQTVRLFGDVSRASVQRGSAREDTTYGRVLRYRLDTGALEVESGSRDDVKIKTGGGR